MTETIVIPADQAVRDRIRTELDRTFVVEAAAGTGKTSSLASRMVALVASDACKAENLVAITFTRKAAAELRERFQLHLERELTRTDGDVRERIAAALREIDRAVISTVHSFCGRLLRQRPVEAGVDPDFAEIEPAENNLIVRQVWSEYINELRATADPLLKAVDELGLRADDLVKSFENVAAYPDVEVVWKHHSRPDIAKYLQILQEYVQDRFTEFGCEISKNDYDKYQTKLDAIRANFGKYESDDPRWVYSFEQLESAPDITLKKWDRSVAKTIKETAADFRERVVVPFLRQWREHVHGLVMALIVPAVDRVERQRISLGRLAFEDLLLRARDLLRDYPRVRRAFRSRFTHLLVDEFQDTDPLQAEIVLYLTSEDDDEKDWRRARPRSGSLFIVGDPKQSIYRFRRADISTYNSVRDIVVGSGGEVLQLTTNFRSLDVVCSHVNGVFASIFPENGSAEQASFVAVDAFRTSVASGFEGIFRLDTKTTGRSNRKECAASEAETIARWIRGAVERQWKISEGAGEETRLRPVTWSDFMLISRDRPQLATYARALDALRVPFEVTGDRGFEQSDELLALLPLFKAVADPADAVSILVVLRGHYFGVSDDEIYRFVRLGGRFSYFDTPPEGTSEKIVHALELLRAMRSVAETQPLGTAVTTMIETCGAAASAATKELATIRVGYLERIAGTAHRVVANGGGMRELVEALSNAADQDVPTAASSEDAVTLMNLHQAKGLEAAIVFLIDPACSDKSKHLTTVAIDRASTPAAGEFAVTKRFGYAEKSLAIPAGWEATCAGEEKFLNAEEDRLLYVAATRAKNALVIGVNEKSEEKKVSWGEKLLRPNVTALPELAGSAPDVVPDRSASTPTLDEFKAELSAKVASVNRPSFALGSPTKLAHATAETQFASDGRGTAWGRLMHRLLELAMTSRDADLLKCAQMAARDEEFGDAEIAEAVGLAEKIAGSSLWDRARRADQSLVEVPFTVAMTKQELGIENGPDEFVIRGAIDLVFREKDQWIIVDYKTDVTEGRQAALVARYAPQLRLYVNAWERMTGAKAKGAIFFLDGGAVEWV